MQIIALVNHAHGSFDECVEHSSGTPTISADGIWGADPFTAFGTIPQKAPAAAQHARPVIVEGSEAIRRPPHPEGTAGQFTTNQRHDATVDVAPGSFASPPTEANSTSREGRVDAIPFGKGIGAAPADIGIQNRITLGITKHAPIQGIGIRQAELFFEVDAGNFGGGIKHKMAVVLPIPTQGI